MEKYCRTGQATDDNMARAHLKAGYLRLQTDSQDITIAFPLQAVVARTRRDGAIYVQYIARLVKHYYWMNFLLHLVPEMLV